MNDVRHVRIFKNGRSRAIRIPKHMDIFGDEASLRQEGEKLIIERVKHRDLGEVLDWLRKQPPLREDEWLPEVEDLPPEPVDF